LIQHGITTEISHLVKRHAGPNAGEPVRNEHQQRRVLDQLKNLIIRILPQFRHDL